MNGKLQMRSRDGRVEFLMNEPANQYSIAVEGSSTKIDSLIARQLTRSVFIAGVWSARYSAALSTLLECFGTEPRFNHLRRGSDIQEMALVTVQALLTRRGEAA